VVQIPVDQTAVRTEQARRFSMLEKALFEG
jgi:hypothetical protein